MRCPLPGEPPVNDYSAGRGDRAFRIGQKGAAQAYVSNTRIFLDVSGSQHPFSLMWTNQGDSSLQSLIFQQQSADQKFHCIWSVHYETDVNTTEKSGHLLQILEIEIETILMSVQ